MLPAASVIEVRHNHHATWRERSFWVCALYLTGSILFCAAATVGLAFAACGVESENPDGVGHRCALLGRLLRLPGRRVGAASHVEVEQFGLGFLSEMNRFFASAERNVNSGWDWSDQVTFTLYYTYAIVAVLNIGLVLQWNDHLKMKHDFFGGQMLMEFDDIVSSTTSFVSSHSLLLRHGYARHTLPPPIRLLAGADARGEHPLVRWGAAHVSKLMMEIRAC